MKFYPTLLLITLCHLTLAQEIRVNNKHQSDPVFPARKKINAGMLTTYTGTTPPPVLIADLTIGISEKLSIGVVGGTTGTQILYGIKLNTVLFRKASFRGVFRMNAIYYPGRDGKFLFDKSFQQVMPWMFTMGIADLEWKSRKGVRWSVGVGYLETHCIDGMLHFLQLSKDHDGKSESEFELFNVWHAGVSIPISKRVSLRPEVVVVMKGFKIIETAEYKVSPINPYLNLIYSFGKRDH